VRNVLRQTKARVNELRGDLWFIRKYGRREWVYYKAAVRDGATVDYASWMEPGELAVLAEHVDPAPWVMTPHISRSRCRWEVDTGGRAAGDPDVMAARAWVVNRNLADSMRRAAEEAAEFRITRCVALGDRRPGLAGWGTDGDR
jgi:hypothetical protein